MKKEPQLTAQQGFTLIEVIITIILSAILATMVVSFFGSAISQSPLPVFRMSERAQLNQVLEKMAADFSKHDFWKPEQEYDEDDIVIPPTQTRTGMSYIATQAGTSGTQIPYWLVEEVIDNGVTWEAYKPTPVLSLLTWLAGRQYGKNDVLWVSGAPCNIYVTLDGGLSGGTSPFSGLSEIELGGYVDDNEVRWYCSGTNINPDDLLALEDKIGAENSNQDNGYGKYKVLANRFIIFDINRQAIDAIPTDPDYGKYLMVTIGMHPDAKERTEESISTLFVVR